MDAKKEDGRAISGPEDFAIGRVLGRDALAELGREGVLVHVELGPDGAYRRTVAVALVDAPIDEVRQAVARVRTESGGFLNNLNMISGFKILEDSGERMRVRIDTRYRFFILRLGLHVIVEIALPGDGSLDLHTVGGRIRDLRAHFRLRPAGEDDRQTLFYCSLSYDVRSVGWLVDYFLRHHPEVEMGVFAATAPVIAYALKEQVERARRP